MIDIHCHILPGIDDGARSMQEALEMCRMAESDGISTIVATPHYKPGSYDWSADELVSAVSRLQNALSAAKIGLTILPGAEVAVFPELPGRLRKNRFLTINNGRYLLVEFRPHSVPANVEQFLLSLMDLGLIPIIAHPERCDCFLNQPTLLTRLVEKGVLLQLTADSITGQFGPEVYNFSQWLINKGLAHIIASDAHDDGERSPRLTEAVSLVADLVGQEKARAMVYSIPAAIIASRPLRLPLPVVCCESHQIKPRSWLRRLLDAAA